MISPAIAFSTWQQSQPVSFQRLMLLFIQSSVSLFISIALYFLFRNYVWGVFPTSLNSYLAAVPLYAIAASFGTIMQFIGAVLCSREIPSIHKHPLHAKNLADFWSYRWNRWVSDWFRERAFANKKQRYVFPLFVFLFSGLWHEWMFTLPLMILDHAHHPGELFGYFLIQACGFYLDRQFFRKTSRWRRPFGWMVILIPIPLFLNEDVLRLLQLAPPY